MYHLELLNVVAFLLLTFFLTYVLLVAIPFMVRKPSPPGNLEEFEWHVIIPCLNEEATIATTVEALFRDHPDVELWVVDDASDDATADVLEVLAEKNPQIHVVHRVLPEAQQGKGAALNDAYRHIKEWSNLRDRDPERQIVIVLDADGQLGPGARELAAGPQGFADPEVGGLQTAVWMSNRNSRTPFPGASKLRNFFGASLVRMQDIEFRTTIAAMQTLRRATCSVGLGGNGQFSRMAALDAISQEKGTPWHGALLEDYELGLHIAMAGYRNEYCHDAYVLQEGLPSLKKLVRQRARWAQGGMQCSRYLGQIFRSPYFSTRAVIEVSYFLFQPFIQVLGVIVWPTLFVILAWNVSHMGPVAWDILAYLLPLIVVTGILPFAIWPPFYRKVEPSSYGDTAVWSLWYWLYMYVTYPVVIIAFWNFLRGRRAWDKTERIAAPSSPEGNTTDVHTKDMQPKSDLAAVSRGENAPTLGKDQSGRNDYGD